MAILPTAQLYGSMGRYWKRRQYTLLAVTGKDKRVLRLSGKRKISWRRRAMRKLKLGFRNVSRINLLKKLRDAYFNMMFGLGGNDSRLNGCSFFGKKWIPMVHAGPKSSKAEEFENKLILEIYKSLKTSHEFACDGII